MFSLLFCAWRDGLRCSLHVICECSNQAHTSQDRSRTEDTNRSWHILVSSTVTRFYLPDCWPLLESDVADAPKSVMMEVMKRWSATSLDDTHSSGFPSMELREDKFNQKSSHKFGILSAVGNQTVSPSHDNRRSCRRCLMLIDRVRSRIHINATPISKHHISHRCLSAQSLEQRWLQWEV